MKKQKNRTILAIHEASGQNVTFQNDIAAALVTDVTNRDRAIRAFSSFGIVTKGNGEAWIMAETHMSLSTGGGQCGQGYPCVLIVENENKAENVQ